MSSYEIAAFYRFTRISDPDEMCRSLDDLCRHNGLKGTLLVAPEGINGTLAGRPDLLAAALDGFGKHAGLGDLRVKMSFADAQPFLRLKVRRKREIVTMGEPGVDPTARTGQEIEPEDWNALISDPDVLVIDTRNHFEISAGTFANSIDPKTGSFREFPDFVRRSLDPRRHKKIAMFCTGGIRCEKASSFLLQEGFSRVYQLRGGILTYLERIPQSESLWSGSCFVFDERVAVDHGLAVADLSACFGCRHPLTAEDRASEHYEDGVCCPHCVALLTPSQKASARERHRQVKRAQDRGAAHLGPEAQRFADRTGKAPARASTASK